MLDRAILPRRVHPLKNQQQRPAILRIQPLLHLTRRRAALREQFLRVRFRLHPLRIRRVKILQSKLLPIPNAKWHRQLLRFIQQFLRLHSPQWDPEKPPPTLPHLPYGVRRLASAFELTPAPPNRSSCRQLPPLRTLCPLRLNSFRITSSSPQSKKQRASTAKS